MGIVLWVLQVVLAFFCISGAAWRIVNYSSASQDIPSVAALTHGAWYVIGIVEIVLGLGLILPPLFKLKPAVTPILASVLAVELLLITALHLKYFGFQFRASNPAMWSLALGIVAAVIAYGRFVLKPFEGT